jgi:hypothetical protein
MKIQLANFYLEFVNDFLTIGKFASYYDMTFDDAALLIALGAKFHEERVAIYKNTGVAA